MRVLFTTLNGSGHFHPLVPLAQALEHAGHQVAFACQPSYGPVVRASGFVAFPVGFAGAGTSPSGIDTMRAALATLSEEERIAHLDERAISTERGMRWVIGNIFGGLFAEQSLPDLRDLIADWHPSVLVHEAFEFGGYLAAEATGLPHAVVQNTTLIANDWRLAPLRVRLNRTRANLGLPPDDALAAPYRYLHLTTAPPAFHNSAVPVPDTTHAVRLPSFDRSGEETLPDWVAQLPAYPLVYATLGTERLPGEPPYSAILAALRDEPVSLIVTVGRGTDPAQFGTPPSNAHVERYIPQSLLLPRCTAIIHHAGWSTTMQALALGLPMVAIPLGNAQHDQAEQVVRLGIGRALPDDARGPEGIRDAVRVVLGDPSYRQSAEYIRDEIAALPGPEYAVELLERLAREKQPILAS